MQNTCMRLTLFALLAFSCCAEDALDNQRVAELARTVSVEKLDQIICSAPSVNFRVPVLSLSQNSFATAMGGGVQVPIAHSHFGFRASADYVVTQHNIVSLGPGFAQNNLRVSAGIVYVSGRAQ
jgi:hypothetical protein